MTSVLNTTLFDESCKTFLDSVVNFVVSKMMPWSEHDITLGQGSQSESDNCM